MGEDKKEDLSNYYELNRIHLQWSFWSSLGALTVGLVVLVAGALAIFKEVDAVAASIATVGGVLTEFIGAGFFFLYSKNVKQLNVFFEQLVKAQDTTKAVDLVTQLPEEQRAKMHETIITMLLTRNEPKTPMSPELIKAYSESMQAR